VAAHSVSIDDFDHKAVDTAVVAHKLPKQGRCNLVINVVWILVIGQIERVHTKPKFPLRRAAEGPSYLLSSFKNTAQGPRFDTRKNFDGI
jgi:hypothetical protein